MFGVTNFLHVPLCQYPAQPMLVLRGGCQYTNIDRVYTTLQLHQKLDVMPDDVMLVGYLKTRIGYDLKMYRWKMTSDWGTKAHSYAEPRSYVLGKHEWTIRNDKCNGGNSYTTKLKMTGCDQLSDFTCRDGLSLIHI